MCDIRISVDGNSLWVDNVFIKGLWRSVKYEEACLRAYGSIADARASLRRYFHFYNSERRHQALEGRRTPDEATEPLPGWQRDTKALLMARLLGRDAYDTGSAAAGTPPQSPQGCIHGVSRRTMSAYLSAP